MRERLSSSVSSASTSESTSAVSSVSLLASSAVLGVSCAIGVAGLKELVVVGREALVEYGEYARILGPLAAAAVTSVIVSSEEVDAASVPSVDEAKEVNLLKGLRRVRRLAAAAAALAGGISLGPEAPSAELGGTLGLISARSEKRDKRRVMVAAGAAAGVAAAFHAPFAGALYAVELVLTEEGEARRGIAAVLVASVTSAAITAQFGVEQTVDALQTVPPDAIFASPLSQQNVLMLLPLGIACGIAAGLLDTTVRITRNATASVPRWAALSISGLAVGLIVSSVPGGEMPESLDAVLAWKANVAGTTSPLTLVAVIAACAKLSATALSKGAGFAGGLFAPTLVIGGLVGGCFGEEPQFALVGASAVMACVCRVPLTAIAMLLELSRNPALLVPMMATTGIAAVVTDGIEARFEDQSCNR